MITRVNGEQYLNIFETVWLFLAAEFIISMSFLKLYDVEADEWHPRRIFWGLVAILASLPVLIACVIGVAAAAKYLAGAWI